MSALNPESLNNETDLLQRCQSIIGLSFQQLAGLIQTPIPSMPNQRKGWTGMALEQALGTTAGNQALPDFHHLGIELKTIPLNHLAKPAESTFVTSIPLLSIHEESWKSSTCYQKLKRVLWVPLEGERSIPFEQRRIGNPFLWSPNAQQERGLQQDWEELTGLISLGKIEEIHAGIGEYLQIRPKGANAKSLCYAYDDQGYKIQTLPRGFYLRSVFTAQLF